MSTFLGLNTSRLSLQAQQKALEATSHNIANANTPGYSRQRAHMTPTSALPYLNGRGMVGTGVVVDEIARVRDRFLDAQIRRETQTLAKFETRHYFLSQIEGIFMEPSETGFNKAVSSFFDGWQELSLHPEGSPVRSALITNGSAFTNAVRHIHEQFKAVRSHLSDQIVSKVEEVNTLAEQLKSLNRQIVSLTAQNNTPNDLLDRRDTLLGQLAEIAEFDAVYNSSGSTNIFIGGRPLVYESISFRLTTAAGTNTVGDGPPSPQIIWQENGRPVQMNNGQIASLVETRDVFLKRSMDDFSSMVWGIVNAVNGLHEAGMDLRGGTGVPFFTGSSLESLRVNEDLRNDPGLVAASFYNPEGSRPGDGRNALAIARLREAKIHIDYSQDVQSRVTVSETTGTSTFETFYRDNIARIGVDTKESNRLAENQASLLAMLSERRDAISGVSLDEEMANMVQFQLAYQASAKVISALDEIYDTLINRMLR